MKLRHYIYSVILIGVFTLTLTSVEAQYTMSDMTVYDCEGTLSDSDEGPEDGQYDHEEDYTFTICVEGAETITAIFDFFATEADYDILTVYDGPDTTSPIIATLEGILSNPPVLVATSGCMTFHFESDDNIVALGWFLSWEVEVQETVDADLEITSLIDCPLGSLDFEIAPRILCDILVPGNFQLLGPDNSPIQSVTPLDCDSDNTASLFTMVFADSLSLSGNYNLVFNGYIVNSCGDTLTFESLVSFQLTDCPFEVEIVMAEQACPEDCGQVEVITYSTDPGPFDISWSHTFDDASVVDICADTATFISVTVENMSTGTSATDDYWYLPYPSPNILNPFESDTFCSSNGNRTLNVDIPGGLWNSGIMDNTDDPLYRFWRWRWSNGTQQDIITYTDENGCSTNDTVYIIPVYAGLDQAVCLSQPTLQLTGNNPNDGTWNGPNTTPDGVFTTTVADTFFISYTNEEGCTDWKRVFVVDQIEFTNIDTLCSNTQINLRDYVNSVGGTWTGPGIDNWYNGTLKAWQANINALNTYFYEIDGCVDSMQIYIQGIWAGPDRTVCSSTETLQMYFDGIWTGPGVYNPIDSTLDISSVSPGWYEVFGTKNGCTDRFELRIQEVSLELQNDPTLVCHDAGWIPIQDIVQSHPDNGIYSGDGIIDDQGTFYFNPALVNDTETFIFFDALNCMDSVPIQVEQELPLNDYEFCEFSNLKTLDDLGYSGYWEGTGVLSPETGLINIADLNVGPNQINFVTDNGCATPINVEIIQFQEANIVGIDQNYCFQDSNYFLTLTPPNGTFTINGIVSPPEINPSLLGPGNHEIEYIVGVDECEDKMSIYIAIDEPISGYAYASYDTLCPEESSSIFVETDGGNGPITAIWDNGLGFGKSHLIFPDQSTNYSVTLSDGCSEELSLDLYIHVIDTFPVDIDYGPEVCYGDSSYIDLTVDDPNKYSITWDGIVSPDGNYYNAPPGDYQVRMIDNTTGCEQQYSLSIPGADPLGAGFSFIPNQDCINLLNNELTVVDLAFGYSNGFLDFGEPNTELVLPNDEMSHIYENIGEFDITQIVFNELGCSDTLVQTICVENVVQVYVPNIFSPNYDGENDEFTASSLGVNDFSMQIYDRWGNRMYSSNDVEEFWDGTHNGREVPTGVYQVMVQYKDQETGYQYVETHSLTLVR